MPVDSTTFYSPPLFLYLIIAALVFGFIKNLMR